MKPKSMSFEELERLSLESKAVYYPPESSSQSISLPIYMTSNYEYDEDIYRRVIEGDREGVNIYSRCGNPSEYALERQITVMEGADESLATASGMAAIATVLFSLLKAGDHVVVDWTTYSSTHEFLDHRLTDFGVTTTFVDTSDLQQVEKAFKNETKLLYLETIANPTMKVSPIDELIKLAHAKNVLVIVDNTFASPYVARPLEWGADIVVESASKFINGHGDALGGTISVRYGLLPKDFVYYMRWNTLTKLGGALSPFNAWLLLRGLQTLPVRMEKACKTAGLLASHLAGKKEARATWYPGLSVHPTHGNAARLFPLYGAMLSFEVKDEKAAVRLLDSLRLASFAGSLGSIRTTCQAPSTMAFLDVPAEQKEQMDIRDGLVRISVGLESIDDLIIDFDCAIEKALSGKPSFGEV